MAKGKKGGTLHKLQAGISSNAPDINDASRSIQSSLTVDDGAVRKGVAVGDNERKKDKGKLK